MKQRLYKLLMVEHRALLDACYKSVFPADGVAPIKTFDDCLSDFYLYLLEAKPKRVADEVEGYYLQQVKDEQALPKWLRLTFRRFLLHELEILNELQEALSEYRKQLAERPAEAQDITLMHVAFALAWFDQHEEAEDRYLFFRSAFKHFSGFYVWPDEELDDADVARVLGLSAANLRTRTSRLSAKVRRLVHELNDAAIAQLNRAGLDVAHRIYAVPEPDIEAVLQELLGRAERELPQFAELVALRKRKRLSARALARLESPRVADLRQSSRFCMEVLDTPCFLSTPPEKGAGWNATTPPSPVPGSKEWIVRKFKTLIGL